MTMTFTEWVRKWRVGPGMNDRHPEIRAWIEESVRFGLDPSARQLLEEGLYSSFDGRVGPGWIPLLDRLAADLVALGWDRDLHQVKEKFGTLRFYVGQATADMRGRIAEAEAESARTCERCGAPGSTSERGSGWMLTLCERCHARREAERRG
jgi:hypothetical protein